MNYQKLLKHTDYKTIYEQSPGPVGLKLAEYMAEKINPKPKEKLLDVGCFKGYRTCFLAKEYDINIVAIDPWVDPETGASHIDILCDNARVFGVEDNILGIETCITQSILKPESFDYAYSVTALDLIRGEKGFNTYLKALKEIHRLLKKDGLFYYAGPMRSDTPEQHNIVAYIENIMLKKYYLTMEEAIKAVESCGFTVIQTGCLEDENLWWNEYAEYKPEISNRRLSIGYIIATK